MTVIHLMLLFILTVIILSPCIYCE